MQTIEDSPLTRIERAILVAMERYAPDPVQTLATPRAGIDRSFGICRCWICRPLRLPRAELTWMRAALARHVLRMKEGERMLWLAEYHLRHGTMHTEELKVYMALAQCARLTSPNSLGVA